jgi:hypothetical protein
MAAKRKPSSEPEPLRPDYLSNMLATVYGRCDLCNAPLSPTLEKRKTILRCTDCGAIADLPESP